MKWIGLLLAIGLCCGCDNQPPEKSADEIAIQDLWVQFQTAVRNGEGDTVASLFSGETIAHYDKVVELARTAIRSEFEEESLVRCFSAVRTRLDIPKSELKTFTGRDFVARNYSTDKSEDSNPSGSSLDSIVISGNKATATVIKQNGTTGASRYFVKDTVGWKMDGIAAMETAETNLETSRQSAGLGKTEFIRKLLEKSKGMVISDDIWVPIF